MNHPISSVPIAKALFSKATMSAIALGLLAAAAGASDAKRTKYVPPDGFGGHKWGELRTSFARLPEEPVGVGAAFIRQQEQKQYFRCGAPRYLGPRMNGPYDSCNWQNTLDRLQRNYYGGGFYILSEFVIPDQGFQWGESDDAVVIHPVVYQYCATWHGSLKKKEPPPDFDRLNKLCGVRLEFMSETREELAKLPADHVTVYDRVLNKLIGKYGPPAHFSRRGQVIIDTDDGPSVGISKRRFSIWRWCPANFNAFTIDCKATVTLTIDPDTGEGIVLYSTNLVWEYAFARQNNGFRGDWMFRLLHAPK